MKTIAALLLLSTAVELTEALADPNKLEGESTPGALARLCHALPQAWVVPVPKAYAPNAVAMLQNDTIIALTETQAGTFIHERGQRGRNHAEELLLDAISRLEQRRDDELQHRIGSWSKFDQLTLDGLVQLRNEHAWSSRSPYLLMAVAGFEGTGAFTAEECGDDLNITHGSLGRYTPPPSNVPVIVFLDHKPGHVHTEMSVAE